LIETHISWVILTGDFAYKIKRPIRLPFVDYREPAARRFYCEEELRLNRRFAPELYLGVSTITRSPDRLQMDGGGVVCDYAVRMRQFASADELGRLLQHDQVQPDELTRFGRELWAVHRGIVPAAAAPRFERWRELLAENARQCVDVLRDPALRQRAAACGAGLATAATALQPLFEARAAAGCARECHGDLHISNVARIGGRLVAFDALEFDPGFRLMDVAQEVAFLSMDLCTHGYVAHGAAFLNGWLAASGDYPACELLNVCEAHWALVRAKVLEIAGAHARVDRFLAHAEQRLHPARPRLILMHGWSGSGKSWVAGQLSQLLPAVWIRSDVERYRVVSHAADAPGEDAVAAGAYSPANVAAVYRHLGAMAAHALRGGRSVIVDASFLARAQRAEFARLAVAQGASLAVIACEAPEAVLRARIGKRQRLGADASEAGVDVLRWQQTTGQAIATDERLPVIHVRTDQEDALDQALRQLHA